MSKTFIISGGGTGGHIFPAVSIATELKKRYPGAKIHFVGALGKMEMTKVITRILKKQEKTDWSVYFFRK